MNIPNLPIAVVMEWIRLDNPWVDEDWRAIGVVEDGAGVGAAPRLMLAEPGRRRTLYPGFELTLYPEEAENYWLNVSTTEPRVFVLWRKDESGEARPAFVTVSYGEAARWMDANEHVDAVPMPPEMVRWVGEFVEAHYRPEEKRRRGKRYASSRLEGERHE